MPAQAWMLDELDVFEVFTPLDAAAYQSPPAVSPEEAAKSTRRDQEVEAQIELERARIEEDAYARGHSAGMAEGQAHGQAQVARVLQALLDATESVRMHEQRWLGKCRGEPRGCRRDHCAATHAA
jgi:flagellar biosynthesis/type III secretory pathway protein FliH